MTEPTPTQAAQQLAEALEKLFSPDCELGKLLDKAEADTSLVEKAALRKLTEAAWGLSQHMEMVANDLADAE
jgi:hypothetical protein